MSSEFVIHVKGEFDYRYTSPQREKIITTILKAYETNVKKPLNLFYEESSKLQEFTTTEDDVKAGIVRMPTKDPRVFDKEKLKIRVDDKQDWLEDYKGRKLTVEDFELCKTLCNNFSNTMRVKKKDTKQIYSLKSLNKRPDMMEYFKRERLVLGNNQSPFIMKLEFAIETSKRVYLGTKYMKGGELQKHLLRSRGFNEEKAKFYAAEILLGLEYLHKMGVVYRALKPEHILMDEEGHVCLSHFGISKRLEAGQLTRSFVETLPNYTPPEMIKGEEYGYSADWWAFGIVLYEMFVGLPPFFNKNWDKQKTFDDILGKDLVFDDLKLQIGEDAKDLILQLLRKDPKERLGSKAGADEVKKHKWFADIDWELLAERKVIPPFRPKKDDEN